MKLALHRMLLCAGVVAIGLMAVAEAQTPPPANTPPPPADPHNIEGVWQPDHGGPSAGPPPGPGGKSLPPGQPPLETQTAASVIGSTLVCTPVQRLGGAGGGMSNLWIVGKQEIVMISEEDQDIRKIYLTNKHRSHQPPDPNGDSIGHWEANTLVVDTIGFSPPHQGEHVVEHITKHGSMLLDQAVITTKDGKTTERDYNAVWRPDYQVWENICEEGFANFKIINGHLDNTGSN